MLNLANERVSFSGCTLVATVLLVSACSSSKPEDTLSHKQQEVERKQALAEISTVNKQINSGVVSKPVATKPVISNATKFSSNKYGVAGSPRVTNKVRVKKGGGRYQVGKPYTIRGKKYYPKEDPSYSKVGSASWYGPNFHGRLTANGEVYDQFGLSAAHPTMPLPSYAKVTNLENGSSVTVRVNDRGPFAHNRIIDLSARAAQLLGYEHKGVAKVRVEYVGKARLDGLDEKYLVASYNPGGVNQNAIPALPNGQPVLVAQANTGAKQNLAAFAPGEISVAPVPQTRPITQSGVPLVLGLNKPPRPSLGLASYFDTTQNSTHNAGVLALESFETKTFVAGHQFTMQEVSHIKFGPFDDVHKLETLETAILKYGPVSVLFENNERYLSLATLRSNLTEVYRTARKFNVSAAK